MEVDRIETREIHDDETLRMKTDDDEETRMNKRARLGDDKEPKFLVRQRRYTDEYESFRERLRNTEDLEAYHSIKVEENALRAQPCVLDVWRLISWSEESKGFTISKLDVEISDYPAEIQFFYDSGTLVYNNKLYYTGGFYWTCTSDYKGLVHSLDLGKRTWLEHPDVNAPRALHSIIAVGDYIYVFGKYVEHGTDLSRWGERFYIHGIDGSGWEYLKPPPKFLHQYNTMFFHPTSYAVYYNCQSFSYTTADDDSTHVVAAHQNLILFPATVHSEDGSPVICVFSCDANEWLPSIKLNFPGGRVDRLQPTGTHDRLVVVDGVFIWHHNGSINGYHLIKGNYLGTLFTIPTDELGMCPEGLLGRYDPGMFFVRRGDDTLFLFFQDQPSIHNIHCHKFRIQKSNQEEQPFALLNENYTCLSTESMNSNHLLNVHPL